MNRHTNKVTSASFSSDGKKIVTASFDSTVKIWDAQSMAVIAELKGHTAGVLSAFFSPDGKKIVTASYDYTAKIWDTQTEAILANLKGHTNSVILASIFVNKKG
ncbi:MAG: PD40 domain-containing protein [Chitinophagaceae bacterium]|nr:PD40 domain-containing protein [Chitinophagaceae bacterium]